MLVSFISGQKLLVCIITGENPEPRAAFWCKGGSPTLTPTDWSGPTTHAVNTAKRREEEKTCKALTRQTHMTRGRCVPNWAS